MACGPVWPPCFGCVMRWMPNSPLAMRPCDHVLQAAPPGLAPGHAAPGCADQRALAAPAEDASPDITAFLTGELQHFAPSRRELAARDDVPVWIRHAYRALLDLETNPDDETAIDALDSIRSAFMTASPIFADALQREIDTKRTELSVARADAANKGARIRQQDSDIATLRADVLTRDESIGALTRDAADHEAQSADMLRDETGRRRRNGQRPDGASRRAARRNLTPHGRIGQGA